MRVRAIPTLESTDSMIFLSALSAKHFTTKRNIFSQDRWIRNTVGVHGIYVLSAG